MYKVGFSIDVTHVKPFDLLRKVIEQKLDYVEFKADNPIIDPETISKNRKQKLLDLLSTADIHVTYHGPYLGVNLVGPGDWLIKASVERILHSIEFAAELNAEYVLIHGGRIYHDFLVWDYIENKSWDIYIENIKRIARASEEWNIDIVIENTTPSNNKNLVYSIQTLQKLIRDLEQIKMVVDIGHLNLTSDVYEIEKAIHDRNFVEHLRGFHIHNNDGKKDLHRNFDSGQINYNRLRETVFSELKKVIYICEVNSVEESVKFKNFIEKIN